MDNKQHIVSEIKVTQQQLPQVVQELPKQEETRPSIKVEGGRKTIINQPSPPITPKVTLSLPNHAATKLRELVQRRDIALLRLGIISVQFENDQIIPLNISNSHETATTTIVATSTPIAAEGGKKEEIPAVSSKLTHQQSTKITLDNSESVPEEPHLDDCTPDDCIESTDISALSELSPFNRPIIPENNGIESEMYDSLLFSEYTINLY